MGYFLGYGADMSEWKGSDAANVALQRFANLIDVTNAMHAAAAGDAVAAPLVDDFMTRLKTWATSLQTPLWKEIVFHAAPLTYIGVGVARLLGWYKSDAEKYGVEILNKVLAFEIESISLCQQVQQRTQKTIPACNIPLPSPVPLKPDPTLIEEVSSPVLSLVKWTIVGVGVYLGAQVLMTWLSTRKGGARG